jgi:hypothetical protein
MYHLFSTLSIVKRKNYKPKIKPMIFEITKSAKTIVKEKITIVIKIVTVVI